MNIKKIVRLSFIAISVLIVFISAINYIVLYQLKENDTSKKHIVKLVSIQEDMNSLVKDLTLSSSVDMLDEIKADFMKYERNFEDIKRLFTIDDTDDLMDNIISDMHKDKTIEKNLHLLFLNEKQIEKSFDDVYTLQKEKIILSENFNLEYPKEKGLRNYLEDNIMSTTDISIIKSFGKLKYYSKEALYQHKNSEYLNKWLGEIYFLRNKFKNNDEEIAIYIDIVKKLGSYVLRIKEIESLELKLQDELSQIITVNKKVNLDIENSIEKLWTDFMDMVSLIMISLLVFTICFIILLEYKVSKNIALGVDEIESKVQDGLLEIKLLNHEIETTQQEVIFTMGAIGEQRCKETGNHVKRVAEYSKLFAQYYGLPEQEIEMLKRASPMHDIGKIAIPDSVLNKSGKFTQDERDIMQMHVKLGYDMLKNSKRPLLKAAAIVANEHHEKWDGTGYPYGKQGEDIHIYGRITAIADVFDALGSDRVYKEAWNDEKIFELFKSERGKHFEPRLVDIFFEHIDEFLKIRDTLKDEFSLK